MLSAAPAAAGPTNLFPETQLPATAIVGGQGGLFTTIGLPPPAPGSLGPVLNNAPAAAATSSHLVITPIFDASIQGDANAAAIEGVINQAIDDYQTRFADPINVSINF